MKFKSRKDFLFIAILILITVGLLYFNILIFLDEEESLVSKIGFSVLNFLITGLLIWIYFGTHYKLKDEFFYYNSGPIKGKIPISSIRKIQHPKTLFAGILKPATALNGLIIFYNKFDEIYISPDSNEKFVEAILKLNPKIEIEKNS